MSRTISRAEFHPGFLGPRLILTKTRDGDQIYSNSYEVNDLYSPDCDVALLRKGVEWARDNAENEHAIAGGEWQQGIWATRLEQNGKLGDLFSARRLKELNPRIALSAEIGIGVLGIGGLAQQPVQRTRCNSAFCLAGNIVHLAGDTFVGHGSVEYCVSSEGKVERISDRAQQLLRINDGAASALFGGGNTIVFINAIAAAIVGEEL